MQDCWYLSLGGCISKGFSPYPLELGPRCEKAKIFLSGVDGCTSCSSYTVNRPFLYESLRSERGKVIHTYVSKDAVLPLE